MQIFGNKQDWNRFFLIVTRLVRIEMGYLTLSRRMLVKFGLEKKRGRLEKREMKYWASNSKNILCANANGRYYLSFESYNLKPNQGKL
jgi:hypothetical protein